MEPSYQGTFVGARRYVLDTFATTKSASMKRRVAQFLTAAPCPMCHGKKLKPESLTVTFDGVDIAEFSQVPLHDLLGTLEAIADSELVESEAAEKQAAAVRLCGELVNRLRPIIALGLGYLSLHCATPTLSGGELQRLRLATQLTSELFGVVYVLDEPSAGLHPQDEKALLEVLDGLRRRGNSVFVVEHSVEVMRHADWLVDIGPGAGERGGRIVYSGPTAGLAAVADSATRGSSSAAPVCHPTRPASPVAGSGWRRSPEIIFMTSPSQFPWPPSPSSLECPAPASRAWPARLCPHWSARPWAARFSWTRPHPKVTSCFSPTSRMRWAASSRVA